MRRVLWALSAVLVAASVGSGAEPSTRPVGGVTELLGLKITCPKDVVAREGTSVAPFEESIVLQQGDSLLAGITRAKEALPDDTKPEEYGRRMASATRDWVLSFRELHPKAVEERDLRGGKLRGRLLRAEITRDGERRQLVLIVFVAGNRVHQLCNGVARFLLYRSACGGNRPAI